MSFRVSQQVVCINGQFPLGIEKLYCALPKAGVTYVIRDIGIGCDWNCEPGEVYVLLVDLHNPKSKVPPYPERGFNAERFAPLETDSTVNEVKETLEVPVLVIK